MDNHLKEKSEQNIKAAETLIANSLYASSVHCSYYACVQLMLHILRSDMAMTEDEIKVEQDKGSADFNGFHAWLIGDFAQKILFKKKFKTEDAVNAREFRNSIGELRKLRRKADYDNTAIDAKKSKNALDYSKQIVAILNQYFTI